MKKILFKILIIFLLVFIGVSVLYGGFSIVKNWSKGVVDNRATAQAIERLEAEYQEKTKQYEETFKENEILKTELSNITESFNSLNKNYENLKQSYQLKVQEVLNLELEIRKLEEANNSLQSQIDYLTSKNANSTEIINELNQTIEELNTQINELNAQIEELENQLLLQVDTMTFNATINEPTNLKAEIVVTNTVSGSCYIELSNLELEINTDKFYAINYIKEDEQYNFTTFTTTYIETEQCTVVNAETQEGVTLRIYAYDYTNIVKLKLTGCEAGNNLILNIANADEGQIIYWQENHIKKYIAVEENTVDMKIVFKDEIAEGTVFNTLPTEETVPELFNASVKMYLNGVQFTCSEFIIQACLEPYNFKYYIVDGCTFYVDSYNEDFTIAGTNLVINNIVEVPSRDELGDVVYDTNGNIVYREIGYYSTDSKTIVDSENFSIKSSDNPLTINFVWDIQ